MRKYRHFAIGVLAYTLAVILWGALVRATGSGAGCGQHWPLCNGQVVPRDPILATVIELTHRVTSGLILVAAIGLVVLARRNFPRGHPVQKAAWVTLGLVIVEAAVGAGIVLLQLVAANASALRAGYIAVHLVNTLLLVAALTTTVWLAGLGREWNPATAEPRSRRPLRVGLGLMLVVSASGAIVSLGDTLFPGTSLAAGLAADLDPTAHFLVRLRIWHPLIAVGVGLYVMMIAARHLGVGPPTTRRIARTVVALVATQWLIGLSNLIFLAPIGLQLVHLGVANLLWIALVALYLAVAATAEGAVHSPSDLERERTATGSLT